MEEAKLPTFRKSGNAENHRYICIRSPNEVGTSDDRSTMSPFGKETQISHHAPLNTTLIDATFPNQLRYLNKLQKIDRSALPKLSTIRTSLIFCSRNVTNFRSRNSL